MGQEKTQLPIFCWPCPGVDLMTPPWGRPIDPTAVDLLTLLQVGPVTFTVGQIGWPCHGAEHHGVDLLTPQQWTC